MNSMSEHWMTDHILSQNARLQLSEDVHDTMLHTCLVRQGIGLYLDEVSSTDSLAWVAKHSNGTCSVFDGESWYYVDREVLYESDSPVGDWISRPSLQPGEDWVFSTPLTALTGRVHHFVCQETRLTQPPEQQ